jgi:transcriptional regulator with GAF, ATPase, and Fis domain
MTSQYLPLILKIESFLNGNGEYVNLPEAIEELRYEMIQKAIVKSEGNNAKAAKMLGMKRTALLHYTLGKYKKSEVNE